MVPENPGASIKTLMDAAIYCNPTPYTRTDSKTDYSLTPYASAKCSFRKCKCVRIIYQHYWFSRQFLEN